MAQLIKYDIEGLKELEAALSALSPKLQASVLRSLNRKAAKKFVVDEIRNVVNYSPKTESKITIINDRMDKTAVIAGPSTDVFWIRFADRGTAMRETEKGASRGQIIGKDQIQPTILNSVEDIIEFMRTDIGKEMQTILERYLKSTNKKLGKL